MNSSVEKDKEIITLLHRMISAFLVLCKFFLCFSNQGMDSLMRGQCLQDTVMLGADNYETDSEVASLLAEGRVPMGVGENTRIK